MNFAPNLSITGIIIRLFVCMFWGILAGFTGVFSFYIIGVLTLVMALSAYDPLIEVLNKRKQA